MTDPAVTPAASAPARRPLSRGKKILFSLLLLAMFGLFVEVVLRCTHLFGARLAWTEPDPSIGWRFVAGSDYWFFQENDHPITGRINAHGWRDREWSLAKTPGTVRVAVLGDSMVEAFQVEEDRTFLALAEMAWNAGRAPRVELMNFGRSGCTQSEELLILEQDVERFAPDVVVLVFTPSNDVQDVRPETSPTPLRPFYRLGDDAALTLDTSFTELRGYRLRRWISPFKRHSALVSLVAERWNAMQEARQVAAFRAGTAATPGLPATLTLCTTKPDPLHAGGYRVNKALIEAIVRHCRERGRKVLLASTDVSGGDAEQVKQWQALDPSLNPDFFEADLGALARALGVEFLGLEAVFREARAKRAAPLRWGHWNYAGHEVAADALVEGLGRVIPKGD